MTRLRALAALAAALPGCLALYGFPRPLIRECPGALLATSEIEGDFLLEQQVRIAPSARAAKASAPAQGLDLIARKRGDELVLIGQLGGLVAFRLIQRGTDVSQELRIPVSIAPLNLLRDLHRERFLALRGAPFAGSRAEGERAGVPVREQWDAGALVQRSFGPPGDPSAVVDYGSPVRLHNRACGYESLIATVRFQPLPPAAAPARSD